MAYNITAEGLVMTLTYDGNTYPVACAKDVSLNLSRSFLELAPKTNEVFREYHPERISGTITGNALVILEGTYSHPMTVLFQDMYDITPTLFTVTFDILDNKTSAPNYIAYETTAWLQDITLNSATGQNPSYSFTLQISGPIIPSNLGGGTLDTFQQTLSSGKVSAQNPSGRTLFAVGFNGKWYYSYSVTNPSPGVYEILIPGVADGTKITTIYKDV
jgi:hypothetical protein